MFPTGPWRIWVCREGRLLVTEGGAPQPAPGAWPVAAEISEERAAVLCMRFGQVERADRIVVEPFAGTIGAAVELADRMATWQRKGDAPRATQALARQQRAEAALDAALAAGDVA